MGADQANRTDLTRAGGREPVTQEHAQPDLQAVGPQGGTGVIAQGTIAVKVDADMGAHQADRAVLAGAGGGEPVAEEHALADLQGVGVHGGTGVVVQVRPIAVQAAADVGAEQAYRTGGGVTDDPGTA